MVSLEATFKKGYENLYKKQLFILKNSKKIIEKTFKPFSGAPLGH